MGKLETTINHVCSTKVRLVNFTCWTLSRFGFLQIYRNKRAQQRKFYPYIFSVQLFGENICLKFPLLGSFVAIHLRKPQSRKCSTCQSLKNFTLVEDMRFIFWISKKSWNNNNIWTIFKNSVWRAPFSM